MTTVDSWFEAFEHPLKDAMQRVRQIIMAADGRMSECIKWKTPTFMFNGNLASFNPRAKKHVSLMFHTGATIAGNHPRLMGGNKTARYMQFSNLADVEAQRSDLEAVVHAWCEMKSQSSTKKKKTAKKAAAKKTAKKAAAKKTAKKATAKKTSKRTAAKKTSKRTAAKKTSKKAASKRTTTRKAPAKKASSRKTPSKKKAPSKKAAAKKTAKRAPAKRASAKKTATRKAPAKKRAGKRA